MKPSIIGKFDLDFFGDDVESSKSKTLVRINKT